MKIYLVQRIYAEDLNVSIEHSKAFTTKEEAVSDFDCVKRDIEEDIDEMYEISEDTATTYEAVSMENGCVDRAQITEFDI